MKVFMCALGPHQRRRNPILGGMCGLSLSLSLSHSLTHTAISSLADRERPGVERGLLFFRFSDFDSGMQHNINNTQCVGVGFWMLSEAVCWPAFSPFSTFLTENEDLRVIDSIALFISEFGGQV